MEPVKSTIPSAVAWLVALLIATGTATAWAAPAKAPFGDKVSAAITYYGRASPYIGTAGLLKEGAIAEAKALGFKTIINLLGPTEGAAAEKAAVEAAGLRYYNIPVTTRAPTLAQVKEFAALLADASIYPVLVHCETANRVGAMWAMYRYEKGVPYEIAFEEGRAIGLTSRENAARKTLGLPPAEKN